MDWLSGEIYSISQTSLSSYVFVSQIIAIHFFFSLHLLETVYKKHHSLYTSVFSWNSDKKSEILTYLLEHPVGGK